MIGFFAKNGLPLTEDESWLLRNDEEYCAVGCDTVPGTDGPDLRVFTTWQGVAYGYDAEGRPCTFETLVVDDRWHDYWDHHTATEEDARRVHDKVVDLLRRGRAAELQLLRRELEGG